MGYRAGIAVLTSILWLFSISGVLFDWQTGQTIASYVLCAVIVGAVLRARRETLIVTAVLATFGAGFVYAGAPIDQIKNGLVATLLFAGLLPVLRLARATAARMSDVLASQNAFTSLPGQWREMGVQIGSHAFGAVLNTGALSMASALVPSNATEGERYQIAMAALRGMSTAALWSPFFVGFAIAQSFLPDVQVWQIMSLGFSLAGVVIMLAAVMFLRPFKLAAIPRGLACLRPILLPSAILVTSVLAVEQLTELRTIEAVIACVPILCLIQVMRRPANIKAISKEVWDGMGRMGDDLIIIVGAMILGAFSANLPATEALAEMAGIADWPALFVIFSVIGGMSIFAAVGLHPMISGTLSLALLANTPHQVSDLVLMQAMLIGWALGAMNSLSSLTVITTGSLFRVSPVKLAYGKNIIFAAVFMVITTFLLAIVNMIQNQF